MKAPVKRLRGHLGALSAIIAGAILLRLIAGVAFVNYDTLYALSWGGQLARAEVPAYGAPIAPTPHPLLEALGMLLSALGPRTELDITLALAFGALAACGWVIFRLAQTWFGWAAGLLAALIFLTRVPVLSYGVRAYLDIPYLLLVLSALLVETRKPKVGTPVLVLLALAGLLRPEAWVFSGLYWLYILDFLPAALRSRLPSGPSRRGRRDLLLASTLVGAAPLIWLISDIAITGHLFWSLTNTRHTASTLNRTTGISNVPEYIPRRLGEILRPTGLAAAATGGVLSLMWLRTRALPATLVGVLAVLVFAAFATVGLPINSRYAFLAAAVLCIFAGAGAFGWTRLERGDRRRVPWMALGALIVAALLAYAPTQYRSAQRELDKLARQERVEDDLVALVRSHAINLRCGPVGVPNHAPIPLLALYLETDPENIISAETGGPKLQSGVYVDPASSQVEADYALDARDPHAAASVPPGFSATATNRSWLIFKHC